MEHNKTKAFFKKYSSTIIVVLIIIAAILVIVFVSPHKKDSSALPTAADQAASATPATATPSAVAPTAPKTEPSKPVVTIVKVPEVLFNSESATASLSPNPSSPAGGLFKIFFQVNADAQDVYISESCHTAVTDSGISFSMIQNNTTTMTNLGGQNCILMSGPNTIKTANGQFKIPAYTVAPFELAVSYQPTAKGTYQVKVTQIGYASSDEAGTQPISIDTTTLGQLKTDPLGL